MTHARTGDLSVISPEDDTVKLSSGLEVRLEALRARQFFKLLRIISHGAAAQLATFRWTGLDEDELVGQVIGLLAFSIPDSEDEAMDFLKSMTKPVGLVERQGVLSKVDRVRNEELWARHLDAMDNPDLSDLMDLIEAIVRREAKDLAALGKRIRSLLEVAQKTGQLQTASPMGSSPAPSTSSLPNMDGETTTSSTSPSAESANWSTLSSTERSETRD